MKELIGVKYFDYKINPIKRDILLFDKIGIPELRREISWLKSLNNDASIQIAHETEWMINQEMLFDSNDYDINWELLYENVELQNEYRNVQKFFEEILSFLGGFSKNKKMLKEFKKEFPKFSKEAIPYLVRIHSINLRNVHKLEAFPILDSIDLPQRFPSKATKKADVLHLVLN